MKKIRLNVANLDATQVLSRDQLRSIFGGSGSGSATCTNNACGALNLPCCSSADWCSTADKSGVCTKRP